MSLLMLCWRMFVGLCRSGGQRHYQSQCQPFGIRKTLGIRRLIYTLISFRRRRLWRCCKEFWVNFCHYFFRFLLRIPPSCTWDITRFLAVCSEESSAGTTTRGAGNDNYSTWFSNRIWRGKADDNRQLEFSSSRFLLWDNEILSILINEPSWRDERSMAKVNQDGRGGHSLVREKRRTYYCWSILRGPKQTGRFACL